jgi:hypothetical protein
VPFSTPKVPLEAGASPPPQSFDASYAAVFNFVGAVRVQTMGVTGAQNFYNRQN